MPPAYHDRGPIGFHGHRLYVGVAGNRQEPALLVEGVDEDPDQVVLSIVVGVDRSAVPAEVNGHDHRQVFARAPRVMGGGSLALLLQCIDLGNAKLKFPFEVFDFPNQLCFFPAKIVDGLIRWNLSADAVGPAPDVKPRCHGQGNAGSQLGRDTPPPGPGRGRIGHGSGSNSLAVSAYRLKRGRDAPDFAGEVPAR